MTSLLIRGSAWIGASAEFRASLNAGSLTASVSLRKIKLKLDVTLAAPSSELTRLAALAESAFVVSGPPLVSVPPASRPVIETPSSSPEATRVAQRKR